MRMRLRILALGLVLAVLAMAGGPSLAMALGGCCCEGMSSPVEESRPCHEPAATMSACCGTLPVTVEASSGATGLVAGKALALTVALPFADARPALRLAAARGALHRLAPASAPDVLRL